MDELRAKHRKEQRELQGKITQKKKSATKKSRKGVNDECDTLERELKERQEQEILVLTGDAANGDTEVEDADQANGAEPTAEVEAQELELPVQNMSLSSGDQPEEENESQQQKKPNRQKARLARRAAEQAAIAEQAAKEAASLPDLQEQERKKMDVHLSKHGLQEKEIRADGHCLYSAVADQMSQLGLGLKPDIAPKVISNPASDDTPDYKVVRSVAADYINANAPDFEPFLEESLPVYVHKIRDTGEWGGHMELMALAKTYGVSINVLHGDGRIDKVESGIDGADEEKAIWLGYYRHGFGLGEHYNSLRKAP